MNIFYRLSHWVADALFYGLFGLEVRNIQRIAEWKGGIVASNHISYLDPPLLGELFPGPISILAKSELFRIPVLGFVITRLNAIPIRRGAIDRKAMERVIERLDKDGTVAIFPEGSRKNFTARPGIGRMARKAQKPILPVYIENSNRWKECLLRRSNITVVVGEPISTETIIGFSDDKKGYRELAALILEKINSLRNGH